MSVLDELARHVGDLKPGLISPSRREETMRLVREAWPDLVVREQPGRDNAAFAAADPPREVGPPSWYPPRLVFSEVADRGHHDELRLWRIDVERRTRVADHTHCRVRAVHVERLADELAEAIRKRRHDDERLQWSDTGSVRVLRRGLFPQAGSFATSDRFKRLGHALRQRLGPLYHRDNGWWQAPRATDPSILPGLIFAPRADVRIRHGRKGVRVVLRNVFPDEIGVTRARRQRVREVLSGALEPLGWTLRDDGWWSPPPYYRGLGVCRKCGLITGPHRSGSGKFIGMQRCACDRLRGKEERWGDDFNMVAQLCQCCAQVVLPSGSRWSTWFCGDCRHQVHLLNAQLGRYAVPIGRHSMMGNLCLTADSTTLDIEIFSSTFGSVREAMDRLGDWSTTLTRRLIDERWKESPPWIPIEEYLERCVTTEEEKMRRFREMMAFFSVPPAPADGWGSEAGGTI